MDGERAYAVVYRLRIEATDGEAPGPWCWYYAESDSRGVIFGDPSIPMATKAQAVREAERADYIVVDAA